MKAFLIICFAILCSAAFAQQSKKATTKKGTVKKSAAGKSNDNSIITNAISKDVMEVELGGYAEKFAANQRVKDLGSMMVRDHRRTKTELKSIAMEKNIIVSEAMNSPDKVRADALEKKKGADFDKHYVDMLISDHTKDIAELKKVQSRVQDKRLKAFLPKALTLMRTHLDSAKAVQAYIKDINK
jgi:putative membrane protein